MAESLEECLQQCKIADPLDCVIKLDFRAFVMSLRTASIHRAAYIKRLMSSTYPWKCRAEEKIAGSNIHNTISPKIYRSLQWILAVYYVY